MNVPVIVGGGLAGLSVALSLAPLPVIVLARTLSTGMTSSELAQGGIACALGADDDVACHAKDTLAAGAGLCDPEIVSLITGSGPKAIEQLSSWGVSFDHTSENTLVLGLEGAHGHRRIVHANGDSTGASIMKALNELVKKTPSVKIVEDAVLQEILTDDQGVCSVRFINGRDQKSYKIDTRLVVMATGSACSLWRHTTVPVASWGHGLVLAAQAGAFLRDIEFVQFHPTALDSGLDPMPLISEALRGEGARLVNENNETFIDELCPRDVVARAIWAQFEQGYNVYLDAQRIQNFSKRFPTILDACLKSGLNPREQLIPIRPVAHYHMGGIATDSNGETNVTGFLACGEAACTGLHGANRLASNSLLEAVVMGQRIADHLRPQCSHADTTVVSSAEENAYFSDSGEDIARVRSLMVAHVGLRRHQEGLEEAILALQKMKERSSHAQAALMIAEAALHRQESRGAHDRKDYPKTDPKLAKSSYVKLCGQEIVVAQSGAQT